MVEIIVLTEELACHRLSIKCMPQKSGGKSDSKHLELNEENYLCTCVK